MRTPSAVPGQATRLRRTPAAPDDAPCAIPPDEFEAAYGSAQGVADWWARTNPHADHESLLTEAAAAVCQAAKDWRPDRGAGFLPYAAICVRNRLWKECRRLNAQVRPLSLDEAAPDGERLAELIADPSPGPEEQILSREADAAMAGLKGDVRAAVMALPPFERKIIIHRYWIGTTQQRLARLLGIPQARVQRAEQAAKLALREVLAPAVEASGR